MIVCSICLKLQPFPPKETSHWDSASPAKFCLDCERILAKLRIFSGQFDPTTKPLALAGESLYHYTGMIKTLIHQAKIAGNPAALATILKLWRGVQIVNVPWIGICPAPSSLYSRFTGKIDIAAHLAEALHVRLELPLILPARETFFRWRKQTALQQRRAQVRQSNKPEAVPRILVVDDVITTGETIHRLDCLFWERLDYLTFASSGLTAKASLSKGSTIKGTTT